jgi:hypothetical protein
MTTLTMSQKTMMNLKNSRNSTKKTRPNDACDVYAIPSLFRDVCVLRGFCCGFCAVAANVSLSHVFATVTTTIFACSYRGYQHYLFFFSCAFLALFYHLFTNLFSLP